MNEADMVGRLIDRQHSGHYWAWITLSWAAVLILSFPSLLISWYSDGFTAMMMIACLPLAAHGYSCLANVGALRSGSGRTDGTRGQYPDHDPMDRSPADPGRVGPALTVISYPFGILICSFFMPLELAAGMPYAGIFMAILTFGIFFTGLAPLLGFAIVRLVMSRGVTRRGIISSLIVMTICWLLSGLTGYALGMA